MKNSRSILKKAAVIVIVAVAVAGVALYGYRRYRKNQELKHPRFYSGNGRLEATEVYVSAKLAGRIERVFVREGDLVHRGDRLVQMQTDTLVAQRDSVIAQIAICEAELAMAKATAEQKQIALDGAKREYERQRTMMRSKATSQQHLDNARTAYESALANLKYALASVRSAEAQIRKQKAELARIEADIRDSLLVAPYGGRIQNLLAHEGEVLAAGGRAMNLVVLTDVYMTFFLPTNIAGKLKIGAEVLLIFDAAPEYPIPARVSFVDPVAQFTPKSVETQVEREKLMFRVKASIDPVLLSQHLELVKTGLPGVAWVKLDPTAAWTECPTKITIKEFPTLRPTARPAAPATAKPTVPPKPAPRPAARPAVPGKPAPRPAPAR